MKKFYPEKTLDESRTEVINGVQMIIDYTAYRLAQGDLDFDDRIHRAHLLGIRAMRSLVELKALEFNVLPTTDAALIEYQTALAAKE